MMPMKVTPLRSALTVDGRKHFHDTDINRVIAPNEFVVNGFELSCGCTEVQSVVVWLGVDGGLGARSLANIGFRARLCMCDFGHEIILAIAFVPGM